ncbi:MAG: hypothetical protein LAP61_05185 [Acidobacteriia bacterium]|nr:hypothetical protein [Terriglobia bacterium]
MKTAVLEFHRNRVKRQQSGAASPDIMKTIGELRSALYGIGKAIEAVERLALAQESGATRPRRLGSSKKPKGKRKMHVIMLPQSVPTPDPASPTDLALRQ